MRIKKQIDSFNYLIPVELNIQGKKIVLNLKPLPYDFLSIIEKRLPSPKPPQIGVLKDSRGRWVKDDFGRPIPELNENDAKYKAKVEEINDLQATAFLYEGLKGDSEIEFETEEPTTEKQKDWQAFYEKIREELKNAGMSMSQRTIIVQALQNDQGMLDQAKKNF